MILFSDPHAHTGRSFKLLWCYATMLEVAFDAVLEPLLGASLVPLVMCELHKGAHAASRTRPNYVASQSNLSFYNHCLDARQSGSVQHLQVSHLILPADTHNRHMHAMSACGTSQAGGCAFYILKSPCFTSVEQTGEYTYTNYGFNQNCLYEYDYSL